MKPGRIERRGCSDAARADRKAAERRTIDCEVECRRQRESETRTTPGSSLRSRDGRGKRGSLRSHQPGSPRSLRSHQKAKEWDQPKAKAKRRGVVVGREKVSCRTGLSAEHWRASGSTDRSDWSSLLPLGHAHPSVEIECVELKHCQPSSAGQDSAAVSRRSSASDEALRTRPAQKLFAAPLSSRASVAQTRAATRNRDHK